MAKFVNFGKDAYNVDVGRIYPTFQKNLVGTIFKYKKRNFAYSVEIGVPTVDIAIL